jgi:hypothetical protein
MKYLAEKKGYVLEPSFDKYLAAWQAHHVTNPAAIRFSFDDRVYLGYRAGGDRDHYCIGDEDVWSSSLGLAILNETGETVETRFPLPVMAVRRVASLPQSQPEYDQYMKEHGDDVAVMHDFRLYEHEGYVYVIHHDGAVACAFDAIRRMSAADFARKVKRSVELAKGSAPEIRDEWAALWLADDVWEPCGADGRLIFPKSNDAKTDVIFYRLGNGTMQLMRRPLPDVSVFPTEGGLTGRLTPDGFSEFGVLEQCVRPGYYDNSHIGPNGAPSLATVGGRRVYIDVCHGVYNEALAEETDFEFKMYYSPFFRVKDYETGDLLYYSDAPVLDHDDPVWSEYSRRGRWIRQLSHRYIVFVGGQVEKYKGRVSEDDPFVFYAGVGDTAIARGEFTVRSLLPPDVLTDIAALDAHRRIEARYGGNEYRFEEKASGWTWGARNNTEKRCLQITRELGGLTAARDIYTRPGYFDADLMIFEGAAKYTAEAGYALIYKAVRWAEGKTRVSFGLLLLDRENLERVYYRSFTPIENRVWTLEGYVTGEAVRTPPAYLENALRYVPEKVLYEIARGERLAARGEHWRSHHTEWLRKRSGYLGRV